jgi:hypothetical protein
MSSADVEIVWADDDFPQGDVVKYGAIMVTCGLIIAVFTDLFFVGVVGAAFFWHDFYLACRCKPVS